MIDYLYKTNEKMSRLQSNSFFIVAACVSLLCLYLSFGFSQKTSAQAIKLEYRINPNDAPEASLMRLPGIGMSKANAIVAYRQQFERNNAGDLAFNNCGDLDKVKGIGPATVNNLCPWLKFD